jgi:hypothetical protein
MERREEEAIMVALHVLTEAVDRLVTEQRKQTELLVKISSQQTEVLKSLQAVRQFTMT